MSDKLFSIIVATYGRADTLEMTLRSLLAQEANVSFEVIVIDNNPPSETSSVAQSYESKFPRRVRYIREGTQGLSIARNAGVQSTRGDVIVFIDDDAVALPGWLQSLADTYLMYPHAACVGGKVALQLPETTPGWFDQTDIMGTFLSKHDYGSETRQIRNTEGIMGTNFSVTRETFLEVGLFRVDLGRVGPRLLSGEELDLCRRIQRAGRAVYYCGSAIVVHLVPQSRLKKRFFRKRAYWEGRTAGIVPGLLDGPTRFGWPPRESFVMIKDFANSLIYSLVANQPKAFKHEIAAWKRFGYMHQAFRSWMVTSRLPMTIKSISSRPKELNAHHDLFRSTTERKHLGTRMTRYLRGFMETAAPEVGEEVIGKRCFILAPHPDDEVLGCGGTIARTVRDGSAVWIAFLTDGRRGINGETADPATVRKAEAIKAAAALGVSSDRLFFFGCEDGRLVDNVNEVIAQTQQIVDSLGIDALFVPYRGDWHPDHRAAWTIGDAFRRNGTRVFEYPIWFGPWLWARLGWKSRLAALSHLRDVIHAVKVRVTEVADSKRRALAAYDSQVLAFARQPWGPAFLENFARNHEIFFVRPTTRDGRGLAYLVQAMTMFARAILPFEFRRRLRARSRALMQRPPIGRVQFGDFGRVTPISRGFGYARGQPIDRYYIEHFLVAHTSDIRGHVLEIGDREYTRRFGGDRVTRSEVLHVVEGNAKATIVADLSNAAHLATGSFDCIILTQTLHMIYDIHAATKTLHRILKPGGVILATFPGISQISRYDMDRWGECWRLTTLSARQLFEEIFSPPAVTVEAYGNVLVAVAFLHGLAVQDLRSADLNHRDQDYELNIAVRAVKPEA
jgi:LmbE family N-acetylglucosaminyl deacetylase/glycosyltransferase involved in cell wall biosynthesis/SAM-dependent methyltransferase